MITFRNLHLGELEKWFDFLVDEIFKNDPKELFRNQWYCDSRKDINGIFVAVDDEDNFLSTLRVFIRDIYINGIPISCAGVGSVGTKEEYRGKKISTTLFEMSLKYMKDRNIQVSYLLSGNHNEAYYNKHGYIKSPLILKISSIDKCTEHSYDYYLRDVNFQKDISALYDIHIKYSSSFNGSTVRSIEYWKEWIEQNKNYNCKVVTDITGDVIAYISYDLEGNKIYISEFGCLPEFNNIFDSLIAQISSNFTRDNLKVIYQIPITSSMLVEDYWEPCCPMYKLITPFSQGDLRINCTEELLETIKGDGDTSMLLLWPIDDV